MATLDGVNLGIVSRETQTKLSNLFLHPLPYSDSSESILLDIFGCQKDISVSASFTGSLTELRTFIGQIEGIQDGQQTGSEYVGGLVTTVKNVFINRFSWNWNEGDTERITYDLDLIEGAEIS